MEEDMIIDALDSIVWYNGHAESVCELISYIQSGGNGHSIPLPTFLPDDCDGFMRVLWSMLVCMYGDYGTSPRTGWILAENKEKAVEFLKQISQTATEQDKEEP